MLIQDKIGGWMEIIYLIKIMNNQKKKSKL